jgi:hypothetical protein
MNSGNNSLGTLAAATNGQDRRRSPRYRCSESLIIRYEGGSSFTGVSVELSEAGMSAMANGLLRVGDVVEVEPVAGGKVSAQVRHKLGQLYGFEFVKISAEQVRRIEENYKKSPFAQIPRRSA